MGIPIVTILSLAGCGGGALSTTSKCPAILPVGIECAWTEECPEEFVPATHDAVPIEELKASKLDSDADSLSCREALDACVRRDRIVSKAWDACP